MFVILVGTVFTAHHHFTILFIALPIGAERCIGSFKD